MTRAHGNDQDRAGHAVASLVADPSVRLAVTIGAPRGTLARLPPADPHLVARCRVLEAAALGLASHVGAGRPTVFCLACDEGNLVVGLTSTGAGLLVLATPGANLGLTLTRVRSAIELDGPSSPVAMRPAS